MGTYILDVLDESKKRIAAINPKSADDIRAAKQATCAMSDEMRKKDKVLREFLWAHFYRSSHVSRIRLKVFKCVQDLFVCFMDNKRCLPLEWLQQSQTVPKGWDEKIWHARVVADYIASMTDRKALLEHKQLFDTYQDMR
jgi:dGTPase